MKDIRSALKAQRQCRDEAAQCRQCGRRFRIKSPSQDLCLRCDIDTISSCCVSKPAVMAIDGESYFDQTATVVAIVVAIF
jgi:hypothetical protein